MTPKQIKALLPKKRKIKEADEKKTLLTRRELASYFKVSPDAIDHYAKKKGLVGIKIELPTQNGGGYQWVVHHKLSDFKSWTPLRYKNSEWWQSDKT